MKVKVEVKRWYPCPHNEAEMRAFSEPYLSFLFQAMAHLGGGLLTQIETRTEGMEKNMKSITEDVFLGVIALIRRPGRTLTSIPCAWHTRVTWPSVYKSRELVFAEVRCLARIPTESLASGIPKAFEQAQNSSANHQKNFISLHKIHIDAAAKTVTIREGESIKLVVERAFEDCFIDIVNRILVVKKGIGVADRVVKFAAGYIKFFNAKGACGGPLRVFAS